MPSVVQEPRALEDENDSTSSQKELFLVDVENVSTGSSTEDNIFKDPSVASYYSSVYEKCQYECRHLFDPDFTWNKQEERKVVWKNDWYVTFWTLFMFTALDFDRNNISQALSDNMLDDLGLTTNDYNTANTINLVCFLASELPSQLISKKIGADVWIPLQICLWSFVSISQAAIRSKAGFFVTRALLGAMQGGFICDVCLWMSYFFTSKELPFRLSIFYIANPMTSVWCSLLSFGLLKIKTGGLMEQSWRWLFLIEGVFTLLVGVASFFKMPPSPAQTKSWYRRKGWYTDREEKIVVNRVLRDDPTKGDMHNRQAVKPRELLKTLLDYDLLPIYIIRFLGDIGSSPAKTYMTLTLRKLGFSTYKTNALTIPYNIIAVITMLLAGYFSEIVNQRSLIIMGTPIWILFFLFPLRYWAGSQVNVWGTYALLTLMLGQAPIWPLTISWCSANSNSVRTRAVSAAIVNIFSQAAGIVSANIYRDDDKPKYHRGNEALIGIAFATIAACVFAKFYFIWRNKHKDTKWNSFSEDEKRNYTTNTTDEGNKRLDFRFVH
ncbi:LAQU0S35e00122g1_1 [Lachancea quebecensis]|uniref:LAQU0S35e00122g1_1 n=1 Tax=Lachancea quebecensis TaxID=1654605 RepID=A0A0P1L0A8_9SACH|nr:LAQU0S35e00122g1_1 [Lachancea quebecensis]